MMDYAPANFALQGQKQGDYFSDTIGPYDYWAIEYAYKPIGAAKPRAGQDRRQGLGPGSGLRHRRRHCRRNPDPRINLFDLGDPLEFSQHRIALVKQSLDKLQERVVAKGEGWQRARQTFSMLLGELAQAAVLSSQYIGGEYTSRAHRDDPTASCRSSRSRGQAARGDRPAEGTRSSRTRPSSSRPSCSSVWPRSTGKTACRRPTSSVCKTACWESSKWSWPASSIPQVLKSIQNAEPHATEGQEVLKLPEVFDTLTDAIWKELPAGDEPDGEKKKIAFSTLRRNVQRAYLGRLSTHRAGSEG